MNGSKHASIEEVSLTMNWPKLAINPRGLRAATPPPCEKTDPQAGGILAAIPLFHSMISFVQVVGVVEVGVCFG